MSHKIYDFAVIGAGIAGASIGSELATDAQVLVLEREEFAGYHTTGRSAAFWEETYGGPLVVPLARASLPLLEQLGVLKPRGALYLGRAADQGNLDSFYDQFSAAGVALSWVNAQELRAVLPKLHNDWVRGIRQADCRDIDVGALHGHYLSQARKAGADFAMRAHVSHLTKQHGVWHIATENGDHYQAHCLVNAAGAWGDEVACQAGLGPLGIQPFLRHMVQLELDEAVPKDLPLVLDIEGKFYFKPENGRIWLSPHDEIPAVPHDAAADDLAIAKVIDLFEHVSGWKVRRKERAWAGLRSFAPDRLPVFGHDPRMDGFAWCAGQGGFGIQTAPIAAKIMGDILLGREKTPAASHIDYTAFEPSRLL